MPATACVLVLSGLDPTGGAGLNADIETLSTHKIHTLPIATSLTIQNTQAALASIGVNTNLITQQFRQLTLDIKFDGIKIGLLSNADQIITITKLLQPFSHLPIVLDPIIKASSGGDLLHKDSLNALKDLMRLCICITPNVAELTQLTQIEDEQLAVESLNIAWVLVTKTDASSTVISHQLYKDNKPYQTFAYDKLLGNFHGSGCTLSSAIIAQIILGNPVPQACKKALDWTYQTLTSAHKIGKKQYHPNRFKDF